jgi:hypothetical protein
LKVCAFFIDGGGLSFSLPFDSELFLPFDSGRDNSESNESRDSVAVKEAFRVFVRFVFLIALAISEGKLAVPTMKFERLPIKAVAAPLTGSHGCSVMSYSAVRFLLYVRIDFGIMGVNNEQKEVLRFGKASFHQNGSRECSKTDLRALHLPHCNRGGIASATKTLDW